MKEEIQLDIQRCAECGGASVVLPTMSAWEFDATCQRCRAQRGISWSHEHPPPRYVTTLVADTLPLFAEVPVHD